MNRSQLEHLIRAAADITGEREIVIIGSQAILGRCPRHRTSSATGEAGPDIGRERGNNWESNR